MRSKIFYIVIFAAVCCAAILGCNKQIHSENIKMKCREYPVHLIEEYMKKESDRVITLEQFKKTFSSNCIRSTHQGSYVMVHIEGGTSAFAFFDHTDVMTSLIIKKDKFLTKDNFYNLISEINTKTQVMQMDPDTIALPISSVELSAHIVQEGVVIIRYSRFVNGINNYNPLILDISFIKNEDIPNNDDFLVRECVPFIYGIDKM